MLTRGSRQLLVLAGRHSQARLFGQKATQVGESRAKHDREDTDRVKEEHKEDHHDHHEDHDDHGVDKDHLGTNWTSVHKHIPSKLGRRNWVSASVGDGIPHGDPADPGYDITYKRTKTLVGTKLNPQRHIYMHHNFQQQFDDHFFIGDFPEPDIWAESEPSAVYREQAVSLAFKFLSERVEGFSLKPEDWEELKGTSWQLHGIEKINAVKFEVLDYLADNMVVKESKFRPRVEQRLRKSVARQQMGAVCYDGRFLGEFFAHYNILVWALKEQSNFFRAPEIPGDYSPLELEALEREETLGIRDLEEDNDHNRTSLNRLIRALHK